jgi:hypothetical protein
MLFQLCLPLLLAATPLFLINAADQSEETARSSESASPLIEAGQPATLSGADAKVTADSDAPSVSHADGWTLRYKFTPDQKLHYETHQTMTLDAMMGEGRKVDRSELRQRRVFTVLSVEENGAAHVAMQFEHVWMKKQIDKLEPIEFDSTMKPAEIPAAFRQVAHGLKGSAPRYWLSSQGASLYPPAAEQAIQPAVSRQEGTADSSIALVEGDVVDKGIELAVGSGLQAASIQKKKENDPGSFLMPLPEDAVKVGDTWKETISVPVRVTQEINRQVPILRTFRLDSVENGVATISFRSSIETPVKGAIVRSQLIQATPRGTMTFDIDRGVMLRREMRYNESVVGALGQESVLSSIGTNTETLVDGTPATP